jgi:metal-dependent amidase/aminoacylase/carboxypeptidase family protein
VLSGLDGIRAEQEQLYRSLHRHPEPAHQELRAAAFAAFFAGSTGTVPQQSASEDFSDTPNALGAPYTY